MRRLLALALLAACTPAARPVVVTPARLARDVAWLAAPERGGRLAGSAEGRAVVAHLAGELVRAGLGVVPGQSSMLLPFTFSAGVRLLAPPVFSVAAGAAAEGELVPAPFSDDADLEAPLVYAGYGIRAPSLGRDDYAGLEVAGKIVVVLGGAPEGAAPSRLADHAPARRKAMTARELGAAALLVISDGDAPAPLRQGAGASVAAAGLPVAVVGNAAARRLLGGAPPLAAPGPLPGTARLRVALERETHTAENVAAWLPATTPTRETVVVGAHWDHLGRGGDSSLAPGVDAVHPGADDNASGVAGVLELARVLAADPSRPRNLLFVLFGAEELGTLGSLAFVRSPPVPRADIVAMVNLDMIGRLREKLIVSGAGTSTAWPALLEAANAAKIPLSLDADGFGGSDQMPFYAAGVPVLFLFTGAHSEYHRPEDTADRIDAVAHARVVSFALEVVRAVLALPAPPDLIRVAAKAGPRVRARISIGTVPDFGAGVAGVRILDVRPGSAAAAAGLQKGDVIVSVAGRTVGSLEDYAFILQDLGPGVSVDFVVERAGARVTVPVVPAKKDE